MNEDQILYRDFLEGSPSSFDKILDKYMEKLIYFIFGFVKRIEVAEDIAQDVFVYILMNKEKYDFRFPFKTYLFIIAKSRSINYLKKENKVTYLTDESYLFSEEEVEDIVFKNDENKAIRRCINMLPENQKRVIYLASIEELSYREICEILDMSLSQVKSLIHRAKKNLKKILYKEEKIYEQ